MKNQVGGLLAASCSCLKPVSTIQITGNTNTMPAIQATAPQAAFTARLRFCEPPGLGGAAALGGSVARTVTGSPPSGTGSR